MPATLFTAITACALLAQSPSAAGSVPGVIVAIEQRAERYRYHFDNPSNFDTVELVPHFFDQRYDADSAWLRVTATYRFLGGRARTETGMTPRRLTTASDIDTFFQSSGDIVTSGTTGGARLQSFAIDQRFSIASIGRWTIDVAMGYRRSRAVFLPADIVVTHTQPPSSSATFTTTRETTVSRVLQSGVVVRTDWPLRERWRITAESEAMPLVRARLITSLPDKYDHDVVADALSFSVSGRVTLERRWPGFSVGGFVAASGAFSYRRSSRYRQEGLGVGLFLSKPW